MQIGLGRARIFGDLNDKKSEIYSYLSKNPVTAQPVYGNEPSVFYIGLMRTQRHRGGVTSMTGADREV